MYRFFKTNKKDQNKPQQVCIKGAMNKLNDLHILLFSISSTSNRKITKNIMKVIANASNFNISSFFCSENSQSNMENILWDNNLFILIWTRTLFRGSQNPTAICLNSLEWGTTIIILWKILWQTDGQYDHHRVSLMYSTVCIHSTSLPRFFLNYTEVISWSILL